MTKRQALTSIFKQLLLGSNLLMCTLIANAAEKVVIMTSYPQEMISQFESAFEKRFPQYRMEILWKQSNDALNYINQHPGEIDVYWTPSRQNFALLAKQGLLLQLDSAWITSPATLQGTLLNDPQAHYAATEIAGLGMVISPASFDKLNLAYPQDWNDLSQSTFIDQVAFPLPTKIGFAGGLIDAILRDKSWSDGWSLLTRITLNARFIENGSTFITDEVAAGRAMVGITMDFFAASSIAKGAQLKYVYPPAVAYSPAHIAIFQNAPHLEAAKAFTKFTLSTEGQRLLFAPDIRKLPVEPTVYAYRPPGYFNPFAYPEHKALKLHDVTEQKMLNAYFEATLASHQALLKSLFLKLNRAKQLNRDSNQIKALEQALLQPALSEAQLFSRENYAQFEGNPPSANEGLTKHWFELAKTRYLSLDAEVQSLIE